MRILLNTLYVTTPEAYLSKDGLNVVVSVNQEEIFRIPIHNIEQIVTFGYMGASPGVMKLCADSGVSLTFLSPQGRYISRSQGPTKGNVLLRKAQYNFPMIQIIPFTSANCLSEERYIIIVIFFVGSFVTMVQTMLWKMRRRISEGVS